MISAPPRTWARAGEGTNLDRRADIWASRAAVEMLTGQRAFAAATCRRHSSHYADEPTGRGCGTVPPSLVTYLKRCLQKGAKQRRERIATCASHLKVLSRRHRRGRRPRTHRCHEADWLDPPLSSPRLRHLPLQYPRCAICVKRPSPRVGKRAPRSWTPATTTGVVLRFRPTVARFVRC